jgi:uncharacterized caspase-like protein
MTTITSGLHALLIGVGEYTHQRYADLPATANDVQTLKAILVDSHRCGYLNENVRVITGESATLCNIRSAFTDLSEIANSDSTVLLYFSGHGGRAWANGIWNTYLCPKDADPTDLSLTAMSGEEFSARMAAVPSKKLLAILDSCHSGASADFKSTDDATMWKTGLGDDYLGRLSHGAGRIVIASCKQDQFSYVRSEGDLSLFTWHLIEALKGAAAVRGDGVIHVLGGSRGFRGQYT